MLLAQRRETVSSRPPSSDRLYPNGSSFIALAVPHQNPFLPMWRTIGDGTICGTLTSSWQTLHKLREIFRRRPEYMPLPGDPVNEGNVEPLSSGCHSGAIEWCYGSSAHIFFQVLNLLGALSLMRKTTYEIGESTLR